jgi:hypothetical protein
MWFESISPGTKGRTQVSTRSEAAWHSAFAQVPAGAFRTEFVPAPLASVIMADPGVAVGGAAAQGQGNGDNDITWYGPEDRRALLKQIIQNYLQSNPRMRGVIEEMINDGEIEEMAQRRREAAAESQEDDMALN